MFRTIAPDDSFPVKRLTQKKALLDAGYNMGLDAGRVHVEQLLGLTELAPDECPACYAI